MCDYVPIVLGMWQWNSPHLQVADLQGAPWPGGPGAIGPNAPYKSGTDGKWWVEDNFFFKGRILLLATKFWLEANQAPQMWVVETGYGWRVATGGHD